jgi:hypothetical protein
MTRSTININLQELYIDDDGSGLRMKMFREGADVELQRLCFGM